MSHLLSLLVYRTRVSVFIKECIILLIVKELGKKLTIQIHLKGSNLSGRQVQRTTVFCLADKCLIFLRSYDLKEKYTHTKYSRSCLPSSDWSRHRGHSLVEIQRGKRFLYPITCFGTDLFILFCFCYLANLTLGQKAASWDKSLEQALAHCSLAQPVRRCTLRAPPHSTEGFLVQVHHHTERLYTPSRFPASLSIWTAFSGYSSPLRIRHSEKHNHAHRAQSAYLRPSATWKQIARTIPAHFLLSKMEKMGLARLSDCPVALLSERNTELSSSVTQ